MAEWHVDVVSLGRLELEFRIARAPISGRSRPSSSAAGRDALAHHQSTTQLTTKLKCKYETQQSGHADQLGHELAGVAVEQARDRAVTPFQEPP